MKRKLKQQDAKPNDVGLWHVGEYNSACVLKRSIKNPSLYTKICDCYFEEDVEGPEDAQRRAQLISAAPDLLSMVASTHEICRTLSVHLALTEVLGSVLRDKFLNNLALAMNKARDEFQK